jgi:predicted transcriptional regulator
VRERLRVDLAYNTVLTILRNLEGKGVVAHSEVGRLHRYHAVVAQERVQGNQVTRLVDKLFLGSPLSLMTHMVEHDALTADEVRTLTALLNERLEQTESPRPAKSKRGRERGTP